MFDISREKNHYSSLLCSEVCIENEGSTVIEEDVCKTVLPRRITVLLDPWVGRREDSRNIHIIISAAVFGRLKVLHNFACRSSISLAPRRCESRQALLVEQPGTWKQHFVPGASSFASLSARAHPLCTTEWMNDNV
jgi:hypothetical protein